jgi:hypothetical protein
MIISLNSVLVKIFLNVTYYYYHHIIILVITLMQGIYSYIPETSHVFRIAAVLYLQFVLHVMLFDHEICFVILHEHFP